MHALRQSRGFFVLLCLLLIAARMNGAHLHLCFDHMEPPQAVLFGDIDLHINDHDDNRRDTDLKLVSDGLAKSMDAGLDGAMLLAFIACIWLLPLLVRSAPLWRYYVPAALNDPRALHPPSRAPPL